MPTYKELLEQRALLEQQIKQAHTLENADAIEKVKAMIFLVLPRPASKAVPKWPPSSATLSPVTPGPAVANHQSGFKIWTASSF
jgi:hypothetical protein